MQTNWKRKIFIFLVSQGITLLGSSIVQLAIIWYIALSTSSGGWVTVLTLCSFIPQMLISPFAGVWADRYSRKLLIILSDGMIAVATFLLLLFLTFSVSAYHLYGIIVISAIRSIGNGIQSPAVNATIPSLVPEESLLKFNGINSSMQSVIQFLSPAISGFILSFSTINTVLLIDILSAVVGIVLLRTIKIQKTYPFVYENQGFIKELKSGFSYIHHHKTMFMMFKNYALYILLSVPSGFLIVLFVERNFQKGYTYLSIIEIIGFLGMFLGGILFTTYKKTKNIFKVFSVGIICYGIFSSLLGFFKMFWLFSCFMFLVSFFIPIIQSAMITYLQANTKPELQGRIFSVLSAIFSGVMPLGMLIFGPLADIISMKQLFLFCGVGISLLGITSLSKIVNKGESK
ncbi:MFS transporter [Listeria monocytogenes]|nr:MFS transporter [Listeria monocytogenes]